MNQVPIALAALGVAASPTIWNIVARNEYRNHTMERMFGGKQKGCYALAAWIFFSSLVRDHLFHKAVTANAHLVLTQDAGAKKALQVAGITSAAGGLVLVMSAYYRLGITGTYLGDYFGILMKERVVSFPFSHFSDPMYLGSFLTFLGISLRENSAVGVGLSLWVKIVYDISTKYFEGPFTTKIYEKAARDAAKAV